MRLRLGELLMKKNLITQEQLDEALEEQKNCGDFLGLILIRRHALTEQALLKVLSEQFNVPCVDLKKEYIDWNVAMRFSASTVLDHQCFPYREDDRGITVAILNPLDVLAVSGVEKEAGRARIITVLVTPSDMRYALELYNKRMAEKISKLLEG